MTTVQAGRSTRLRAARRAALALVMMAATAVVAAEAAPRPDQAAAVASGSSRDAAPSWRFSLTPYVWAAGLSGTVRPFTGAPTLSVERSFSETLEDLDAALFVSFGAERGRFVALADVSRVVSSRDGVLPGGIPARGRSKQTVLSLAAGYRVHAGSRSAVDVFAGARAFELEADVQVLGGALSASPDRSFVDPLIGVRMLHALSPRWSTILYLDVGGFGVGAESTLVASALLNYRLGGHATLSGGYRSMSIDYDDKGTLADVRLGGPVFALGWRF